MSIQTMPKIAKNKAIAKSSKEEQVAKLTLLQKELKVSNYLHCNYDFSYNEVNRQFLFRQKKTKKWLPLQKADLRAFQILAKKLPGIALKLSVADLETMLLARGKFSVYNPFKSYFKGLRELNLNPSDAIDNLADYVVLRNEAEDRLFFKTQLKKYMIRTIRCVFHDYYFNKTCLIFSSPSESIGKSYFLRKFCPQKLRNRYYTQNFRINNHVDSLTQQSSNFLINLDEIEKMTAKKNAEDIKALISTDSISVRLTHEKDDSHLLKRCSFAGTCNSSSFLRGDIGYSRWLCFNIANTKHFGSVGSEKDKQTDILVDQAWLEAYSLFLKDPLCGELTSDDKREMKERTKLFTDVPLEEELIAKHWEPSNENEVGSAHLQLSEIVSFLLDEYPNFRFHQRAVSSALCRLAFVNKRKRLVGGGRIRGYWVRKPGTPEVSPGLGEKQPLPAELRIPDCFDHTYFTFRELAKLSLESLKCEVKVFMAFHKKHKKQRNEIASSFPLESTKHEQYGVLLCYYWNRKNGKSVSS